MSEPDPGEDPYAGLTAPLALPDAEALLLLREGTLAIEGRLLDASNATLYCAVSLDGVRAAAVYKPVAGEQPLWDFPDGTLAEREVAAYEVSRLTGWDIVPPTLHRDGPAGPGMVQLWVDVDESVDVVRLVRGGSSPALQRVAVLDAVLNNADRKGRHLLPTGPAADAVIKGCDHGLSFHSDQKLRTVLWHWAGEPLTAEAVDVLVHLRAELAGSLGVRLGELLTTREVRRTVARVDRLLGRGVHPDPPDGHRAIPWPPF